MNQNVMDVLAYIAALVFAGFACYLWMRSRVLNGERAQLAASLADSSRDLERQKKALKALEDSLLAKHHESLALLKEKDNAEKRYKQVQEELASMQALQDGVRSLSNQLEHYKTQSEVLLVQLAELDGEKASFKNLYEKARDSHAAELDKAVGSLREENKTLAVRSEQLEKRLSSLQSQLSQLKSREHESQEDLLLLKRKVHQSDHLFKTIRGQKEMLDERLQNWETALRMLGSWILAQKGYSAEPSQRIGELVAKALQLTQQGSLFVEDAADEKDEKMNPENQVSAVKEENDARPS